MDQMIQMDPLCWNGHKGQIGQWIHMSQMSKMSQMSQMSLMCQTGRMCWISQKGQIGQMGYGRVYVEGLGLIICDSAKI